MLLGSLKQVKSHIAISAIVTALSHNRLQPFAKLATEASRRAQLGKLGGDTWAESDVLADVIR
jgi:hypothetical protein